MLFYPENYTKSKEELFGFINKLSEQNYILKQDRHPIHEHGFIDMISIKKKPDTTRKIVFTIGLHGIEGYVGHACLMVFLKDYLVKLAEDIEIIIFHPVNPYGMKNYKRTNEHNVDLNRNFSQNNFSSTNKGYDKAISFFEPKKLRNRFFANFKYYYSVVDIIRRFGVSAMKEATLLGQKVHERGLYYSGTEYELSTEILLNYIPNILSNATQIIWLDLHTGYGPRYQMSVVNSVKESESPQSMSMHIHYPLVVGLTKEAFYEIDGDLVEMIYHQNNQLSSPTNLYATCLEFGTLGDALLKSIASLKAMVFENSCRYIPQSKAMIKYVGKLMREQYMPSSKRWREKAEFDFKQFLDGILAYKKYLK